VASELKTYFAHNYRDSFNGFQKALKKGGYKFDANIRKADILFFDTEPRHLNSKREAWERMIAGRPLFIYPHTPYAFWLWDGFIKPSESVSCNFVVGESAKLSMQKYGYPNRVEVVGFSRCKVRPFMKTTGRRLAYASSRLIGEHGYWPHEGDRILNEKAIDWLLKNRSYFDEVIFYHSFPIEKYGVDESYPFTFVDVGRAGKLNTQTALEQLKNIDIVISCNTFGFLAIAQGIPTVLVGHNNEYPMHSSNYGVHYAEYAEHCDFPLDLFSMSGQNVLALRQEIPECVRTWKQRNIEGFNPEKFLSVVNEYN